MYAQRLCAITASCFYILALSPAAAEETPDQIVVTATKYESALAEVPRSVDILAGATIDAVNAMASGEDIVGRLAGVQAAVANGNQIAFQIRGIGAVDHQALTPGAAAVYLDGVFLATNVQTGPLLYDLERVEVLKGPQGSLYGRNASSGAIHFLSARPSEEASGYLGWSYGRFDRVDASGALSGPIAQNLNGRIAGRYLAQDPVINNVTADPSFPTGPKEAGGKRDEFGLRGALEWDGAPATILLRVHYEEDNGVNPAPLNSALSLEDHQISVGPDGVQDTDNEFYGVSVEAEGPLGDWTLFSLTAIEGYNQQYGFDFDGSQAPFGVASLNANLSYDRDFLQWSEELRLSGDWSLGHSLIGAMAAGEDFEQRYTIWCGELDPQTLLGTCRYVGAPGRVGPTPASPGVATTLVTDIEQTRVTAAIFTYHDLALTERLTLSLGGRFTHETIKGEGSGRHIFDDGVIAFNNRDGAGPAIGANRIKENRFTGDVALRYRFSDWAMVYASFSSGYKSGGFNGEVQNNATHFQDEGLFSAETVNAFELGYKGTPTDNVSFEGAFFYQDYNAPQARIFVNFPLPGGGSIVSNSLANLDEARAYGFEGKARWTVFEGLTIDAAVTALETKIDQTTDIGGNAGQFDGNPLPFASEVSSTFAAHYYRPLNDVLALDWRFAGKYQSAFFLDAEGLAERRQGGYTLLDAEAMIVLPQSGFRAGVWANNLLNEQYAVSGFGFIGYNVFLGPPRQYGVRLRKDF